MNNEELSQLESQQIYAAEGHGPTEGQILAMEITAYLNKSECFRDQAREHLDALIPQPGRLAPRRNRG